MVWIIFEAFMIINKPTIMGSMQLFQPITSEIMDYLSLSHELID